MNKSSKDKTKACCRQEHEKLVDHVKHCDNAAQSDNQRRHCRRHAAWRSGRQARKCIEEEA